MPAKSLCSMTGRVMLRGMETKNAETLARLMRHVDARGECWLWTGASSVSNHGGARRARFAHEGKNRYAARVMFEVFNGPLKGEVCHTCDNGMCVRLEHLFDGTHTDNMRDMANKGRACKYWTNKTHCKNGHQFTPENTKQYTNPRTGKTCRFCRKCLKAYNEEYNRKRG